MNPQRKALAMQQRMAPLPKEQVTPSVAFQTVGIDYCGPLYVKNGQRMREGSKKKVEGSGGYCHRPGRCE